MAGRRIGIVLVHGIGKQQRYELLREFGSAFFNALLALRPPQLPRLSVDKVELNRRGERTRETSDLHSFFGDWPPVGPQARRNLFRPVTLQMGDDLISLYEVYWADEDLRYSFWEKLTYNLWLVTTLWNPLFNWWTRRYRDPALPLWRILAAELLVFGVAGLYHLAELLLALLPNVLRRHTRAAFPNFGEWIYEFAGDVKLYVGTRRFFHNQTKREVILARFDEVAIKASLENDELHVVAHSLGAAIALDGLSLHAVQPSKMASGFLRFLRKDALRQEATEVVDLCAKLRTLVTLGAPLDKLYFFWPSRRASEPQPPFRLRLESPAPDAGVRWHAVAAGPASVPRFRWLNATDLLDPIGAGVRFPPRAFPAPANTSYSHEWLPSRAHARCFANPELMKWLAAQLYPAAGSPAPPSRSRVGAALRRAAAALLLGVTLAFLGYAVPFAADFSLGLAHDLYMDAESHTIFQQLEDLDRAVLGLRGFLGHGLQATRALLGIPLGSDPLVAVVFMGGLAALAFLAAAPFALWQYRRTEAEHAASRKL